MQWFTYILFPRDPFCGRERINCAFKVNIIPFTNIYRIQFRAQLNADLGRVCKKDRREMVNNQTFNRLPIHALPIMPKALFLLIPIDVCTLCKNVIFGPKRIFSGRKFKLTMAMAKSDCKRRLFLSKRIFGKKEFCTSVLYLTRFAYKNAFWSIDSTNCYRRFFVLQCTVSKWLWFPLRQFRINALCSTSLCKQCFCFHSSLLSFVFMCRFKHWLEMGACRHTTM